MALKYSQLSHNDRSSVSEGVGNDFNRVKDGSNPTPPIFNSNSKKALLDQNFLSYHLQQAQLLQLITLVAEILILTGVKGITGVLLGAPKHCQVMAMPNETLLWTKCLQELQQKNYILPRFRQMISQRN